MQCVIKRPNCLLLHEGHLDSHVSSQKVPILMVVRHRALVSWNNLTTTGNHPRKTLQWVYYAENRLQMGDLCAVDAMLWHFGDMLACCTPVGDLRIYKTRRRRAPDNTEVITARTCGLCACSVPAILRGRPPSNWRGRQEGHFTPVFSMIISLVKLFLGISGIIGDAHVPRKNSV